MPVYPGREDRIHKLESPAPGPWSSPIPLEAKLNSVDPISLSAFAMVLSAQAPAQAQCAVPSFRAFHGYKYGRAGRSRSFKTVSLL